MHRSMLPVLLFVALASAASGAFFAPQDEPATDEARHTQAVDAWNHNRLVDAARLFEDLLGSAKYRPEALFKLGEIAGRRQQLRQATERFEQFLADYPKRPEAPSAQLAIAQILVRQQKKDDAIKAFKKLFRDYPNTDATRNSVWQYWNLQGKAFQFGVTQSYTEGEAPTVQGYIHGVDKVDYRIYRLDAAAVLKKIETGDRANSIEEFIATAPAESRKLVKEWSETPRPSEKRWEPVTIRPDITGAGLYLFEAEHDEIAMHVTLVVARYGLIVKSAADRTIVFAVDRRTGRAVADMNVRVLRADGKADAITDKDGLAVVPGGTNGQVLGVKEGEFAFSNSWFGGASEQRRPYIFTDRPVYRPNQTVYWKAVFRTLKDGEFLPPTEKETVVTIRDPKGNVIQQKTVPLGAFGSVSGEMRLGDEPPIGAYYVAASIGGHGQFRVEEYRKPEYEVTVALEGGPPAAGDDLQACVDVRYYFGSPVVESEVSYVVHRRRYWKDRWSCFRSDWAYEDDDDEMGGLRERGRWGYDPGEQVAQGVGRTDKEGRFRFVHKPAAVDFDAVYMITAKVVDRSRREVTGGTSVKVTRASVELSLAASRYVFKPQDRVLARVRAVDPDGKPISDLRVSLEGDVSTWRPHERGGVWDHESFWKGESRTDEQGVASFEFTAEQAGRIRLHATARDKRGRDVSEEQWIWVSDSAWSAAFQNFQGLDIVADKSSYAVGETAQVLITSQHKNVHALFTVECGGVLTHGVVHIKGHSASVEVPIASRAYSPNVYFSVAALVKNEYVTRTRSVAVPPADSLLHFKIGLDKPQYRPRDKARVTVTVTDAQGKPAVAELAIGMVDESIYAVQAELTPDMRKFFFAKRPNAVATNTSLHFRDWGRAEAEGLTAAPSGSVRGRSGDDSGEARRDGATLRKEAKSKGDSFAATEMRSYFPDTMHWAAAVVTGEDGTFSFETTMPDSLTTWRTTVRGLTASGRIGQQAHEIVCRKEVIVRLTTPRFLTQNDVCTISAVVHNYRADVDEVVVSLEAAGLEVTGERERRIKVPVGEDRRVDWTAAASRAGSATLTARALSGAESDAMQLVLPVLPHGAMRQIARAGVAEVRSTEKLVVPASAIAEATELRLSVAPSVASQVLESLDYLAGYPYGCVEQTMSRFLPTVITGSALRRLGLERPQLTKELPEMVSAGLQRLYNFQHGDGGWGWWEADATHPFMTAYVLYGLAKAREADFFVDTGVLERGLRVLTEMVKADRTDGERRRFQEAPIDTKAYMVFALAENGRFLKEEMDALFQARAELTAYSKAILALAMFKASRPEDARVLVANLDESAKEGGAHCWWAGHGTRGHWMSNTVETTAYALKALVAVDAKHPKVHKIVRWLAASRQGNRWHSTKDTAAAVFALTDVMAVSGELDPDFSLAVSVDGREVMRERITKANLLSFDGSRTIALSPGEHEVTIEKEGRGTLYYAAFLRYFDRADRFEPSAGAIAVERTYSRVVMDGKERRLELLEDGATLKSGELVEVTLTLSADGPQEYVMVDDPLPSGFEVVKEDRFYSGGGRRRGAWWYSRIEARDEKVCVASTSFDGARTVSYVIRAETPGDFRVLPTQAWNMYAPDIAGSGAGARLKVVDR